MARTRHQGVTLVELLVTMALVAIILFLGVPAFQRLVAYNNLVATTNDVLAYLQLARENSAMDWGDSYTLCAKGGLEGRCDSSSREDAFTNGWIVFKDTPVIGRIGAGDVIDHLAAPSGNTVVLADQQFFSFWKGELSGGSSAHFVICDPSGAHPRRLIRVFPSGSRQLYIDPDNHACTLD